MRQSNDSPSPTRAKGRLAEFNWADPLKFEDLLTEDERAIRDAAHAYCQEKLLPRVLMANRDGAFRPRDHERDGRDGVSGRDAGESMAAPASTMSATG